MDTLGKQVLGYRVEYAIAMFVFFFICFTALGIYFTQILPHSSGGFREHPCFCFGVQMRQTKMRREQRNLASDLEENAELKDLSNFESISSAKYSKQRESGNMLRI